MPFLKVLNLTLLLLFSFQAQAQDLDSEITLETGAPTAKPSATSASTQTRSSLDPMLAGWNTRRYTKSIGFSASFLGTNTIVYENYFSDSSLALYFGANKAADTYSESNQTVTTGTATVTTTTTTTYGGVKNPMSLSLGAAYYGHTFRNNWLLVRTGLFGGVDYFTGTNYNTGSHREVVSSATPNTISITDTNFGDVSANRSTIFRLGPAVDTSFFLRWFPQLAIGFQAAILYSTDNKLKTSTNQRSRTYDNVSGVDQPPTTDTSTSTNTNTLAGPSLSTFAVAGQQFNLFGNFTLKYVW